MLLSVILYEGDNILFALKWQGIMWETSMISVHSRDQPISDVVPFQVFEPFSPFFSVKSIKIIGKT